MAAASRVAQSLLRVWQFICSVIVLGILAHFVHEVANAGVGRDGRIIYGVVVASISTLFAIVFMAPFMYSFLAFPADFALFVMWLVLFCLLMTRTGTHTCTAPWFWNYWGYYWGGWWRNRFVANSAADIRYTGCNQWRTALAFSFMAMFAYLITTILGAYVVSRWWTKRRRDRVGGTAGTTGHPQTSQIGGPGPSGGVVGGGPGTGPGTTGATGQPGTYV